MLKQYLPNLRDLPAKVNKLTYILHNLLVRQNFSFDIIVIYVLV